ncbi:MAG: GPW/gp25 family protein [Comamonadaceae bacterium]|nr:GPW/gp25 family protein [Comamonadaceae bacterium]
MRQAIQIVLSTARGERVMRPDFGCDLHELVFAPNDRATQAAAAFRVREALQAWEPRIDVLDVQAYASGDRGELLLIHVAYRVRSSDNRFNLVYPFYLDRPLTLKARPWTKPTPPRSSSPNPATRRRSPRCCGGGCAKPGWPTPATATLATTRCAGRWSTSSRAMPRSSSST